MAINLKKLEKPIVADSPAYFAILIGPLRFSMDARPISILPIIFTVNKGPPLSENAQLIGQQVGILLLVCLMGLAFFLDIERLLL